MATINLTKKQMRRIVFALEHSLDNLLLWTNEKQRKEYVDLINKIRKKTKK